MGDLNIDTADITKDTCNYLSDLCDTFSLTNIKNGQTCFKAQKVHLLTFCLQTDQGAFPRWAFFSDHHKLILSVFRSYFIRIPP